ncbi:ArsR family transcriptional regulator [Entomomonas sp. E2T0]|uniref:VpaChn25_0724 family phage protein n=1 Tax=Entomomonas sp. E2T0 TaxID=2930213 RepID=UPI0022281BDF|nr:winged-helix domain-containing protein [Entomomonas sp. E2T0]UYZ84297.1 ArsR family transcriptional regulator [Entomomonas sp. E2T0]
MKQTYKELLTEQERLVILRVLTELNGYTSNNSIITELLKKWGLKVSHDQVKTHLRWLDEQGLITIEDINGVLIATLTERGEDVANGFATVDGVKRPRA